MLTFSASTIPISNCGRGRTVKRMRAEIFFFRWYSPQQRLTEVNYPVPEIQG